MRSCERPLKRSARDAVPSSISKRYSLSIRTQGSSCRHRASSSLRRVSSFSASSSSSRAASHSSRVTVLWSVIVLLSSCCRFYPRIGRDIAARPWAILIQLHHGPWALDRDSCKRDSVCRYPENTPNKCGRCRLQYPDRKHSLLASPV